MSVATVLAGLAGTVSPAAAEPAEPALAVSDLTVLGGGTRDARGNTVGRDVCGPRGTVLPRHALGDGSSAYYAHGDALGAGLDPDRAVTTDLWCTFSLTVTAAQGRAYNLTNLWMAGQSRLAAGTSGTATTSVSSPSGHTNLTTTISGPTTLGENWQLNGLPSDRALIGGCGTAETLVVTQRMHLPRESNGYLSNVADPGWNSTRLMLSSVPCND
ncbi:MULTISPECIES: DUF4360 domain-containing protein [unclassified Actinoplanes]|uniref:DUF4360 domain-containing protein n=1 Tax=unclassified Actinoplanes TaxID=2626549 RepID=UPI0002EB7C77|nr:MULTISPECIES: DUF4360 domain-containing protein [unclassified Actinoplanes]